MIRKKNICSTTVYTAWSCNMTNYLFISITWMPLTFVPGICSKFRKIAIQIAGIGFEFKIFHLNCYIQIIASFANFIHYTVILECRMRWSKFRKFIVYMFKNCIKINYNEKNIIMRWHVKKKMVNFSIFYVCVIRTPVRPVRTYTSTKVKYKSNLSLLQQKEQFSNIDFTVMYLGLFLILANNFFSKKCFITYLDLLIQKYTFLHLPSEPPLWPLIWVCDQLISWWEIRQQIGHCEIIVGVMVDVYSENRTKILIFTIRKKILKIAIFYRTYTSVQDLPG